MSWFGNSINLETLVNETCSEAIPDGEIDYNKGFEIVDLLKTKRIKARDLIKIWESKIINNRNPNSQISLLNFMDLCIKNAGINFSLELFAGNNGSNPNSGSENDFVSSYGTMRNQFLNKLLFILHNSKTSKEVKNKILENIETWHILFAQNSNLNHNINAIYNNLKNDKFEFPKIDQSIILNDKFLESQVPPAWVDSDSCMIGFEPFTMLNRKHHCRNCGGVFCQQHSSQVAAIPMMGLNEPVRVCDSCFEQLKKPVKQSVKFRVEDEEDKMLKKALMLSLQDAPPQVDYAKNTTASGETIDEEEEDLKAAIAASLADMQKNTNQPQKEEVVSQITTNDQPISSVYQPMLDHELNSRVSYKEQETISLFSQLMKNLKQQQAMNGGASQVQKVLQNEDLSVLYTEIIKLKTKLGQNINEDLGKYDKFVDLQAKLATIVRLYDGLLEKRLAMRGYERGNSVHGQPIYAGVQPVYTGQASYPVYSGVQSSYPPAFSGASQNFTGLQQNYTGLSQNQAQLQQNYTGLQQNQAQLQQNYTGLQQNYTGMQQNYTGQQTYTPPSTGQFSSIPEATEPIATSPPQAVESVQQSSYSEPIAVPAEQITALPAPSEPTTAATIAAPSEPPQTAQNLTPSEPPQYGWPPQAQKSQQVPQAVNYDSFSSMFPHAPNFEIAREQQARKEEEMLIEL